MPPGPRRPLSTPLTIAKWLAIAMVLYAVPMLIVLLAGWGRFVAPLTGPIPLAIALAPYTFAALFIWHWAAAALYELRAIRATLRAIRATLEQAPRPPAGTNAR